MPPNLGVSDAAIVAAVRGGELDEAVLDRAVARVLQLVDRAGVAGGRPADFDFDFDFDFDVDAHHAFARAVAADCAVLLKNDGGLLPLRPSAGDTVAVIGEFARTPRYQGAGSSQVNSTRVDVPLDELRTAVPEGVEVAFVAGFGIGTTENDEQLAAEAVELAGRAGTVVAFLGLPATDESEGFDRGHMDLPPNQTALLPRLAAANPNLVVVLANGSAVRLPGLGAPRAIDSGVLAVRAGGRRRGRGPVARRGQSVRKAGGDPAAPAGRQPGHAELPR
jgi:beta-glucosidase